MAALQEIDKAIGAHGMWKLRLKAAIDSGRLETPIATIRADRDCPFGKWLHGPTIAPATRASAHFARVAELHAQFHQTTANIAALATSGQREEATAEITGTGEFSRAHRELAAAMMEWKAALR